MRKSIVIAVVTFLLMVSVAQAAPPGPEIDQAQPTWQAAYVFGQWDGQWDGTLALGQTFTSGANKKLCQVTVNLFDTFNDPGTAPVVLAELWSDDGTQPGLLLGTATNTISADVTTSYLEDYTFTFDGPRLHRNTRYWLVLRTNPDNVLWPFAAGYQYGASDPYSGGQFWRLVQGSWVAETHGQDFGDLYFREYVCNK